VTTFDVPLTVKATSADAICAAGVAPALAPEFDTASLSLTTLGDAVVVLEADEARGAAAPPLPNTASVAPVVPGDPAGEVAEAAAGVDGEEL